LLGCIDAVVQRDREVFDPRLDAAAVQAVADPSDASPGDVIVPVLVAVADRGEDGQWVVVSQSP
jgi:hypothetical protein